MKRWRVKFSMRDGSTREFYVDALNLDHAVRLARLELNGAPYWATESQVAE